jgi:hypothetical protein
MRAAPKLKKRKPASKKGRIADHREFGAASVAETAGAEPCKIQMEEASTISPLNGVSNKERYELIAEAAYFRAEQRGFAPGREWEDWLSAEAEIEVMLLKTGKDDPAHKS